jgi:hypothetical protein
MPSAIGLLRGSDKVLKRVGNSIVVPSGSLEAGQSIYIRDTEGMATALNPLIITSADGNTFGKTSTDPGLTQLEIVTESGWIRLVPNTEIANDWFLEG